MVSLGYKQNSSAETLFVSRSAPRVQQNNITAAAILVLKKRMDRTFASKASF
jgi:hypothetical protein